MKKFWYILTMMLCVTLVTTSCGDDDDENILDTFGAWKDGNDAAFEKTKKDPEYTEIKSGGNNGSIYYKVLKEGTGTEDIYYTSTIKLYYTGSYVYAGDYINEDNMVFDSVEPPYKVPYTTVVKDFIQGAIEALQLMKVGDRWEFWVPYNLGYGASGWKNDLTGRYNILPFSTLKFEMEVVEIVKQ